MTTTKPRGEGIVDSGLLKKARTAIKELTATPVSPRMKPATLVVTELYQDIKKLRAGGKTWREIAATFSEHGVDISHEHLRRSIVALDKTMRVRPTPRKKTSTRKRPRKS